MGITTKDMLKELFKKKGQHEDTTSNPVEINYSDFDKNNISSTFIYAISKYGNSICSESNRLKNILSDLAPHLSKEIKLLHYLSKGIDLNKLLNLKDKEDADLLIWINNAISYLINNEMIDETIAYEFCINLVCDITGRDISDVYLKEKKEKSHEKEILNLLTFAKKLIHEKKYNEATEKLQLICAKESKENIIQKATALLENVTEHQLMDIVMFITRAIEEERYKDASDNLEIAYELVNKCKDCKNVRHLSKQLKMNEKKINSVIKNCFKNAEKEIKKKDYDKAHVFINHIEEISGNYFHMDDMCSFWHQRLYIEKLIDSREFERAKQNINELRKNRGLKKDFVKYISALEKKIKSYLLSLILFKCLFFLLFVAIWIESNAMGLIAIDKKIIPIVLCIWLINVVIALVKAGRKRVLFCNIFHLIFNYGIWLLGIWCANNLWTNLNILLFIIILPILSNVLLLLKAKGIHYIKIFATNIGIIVLLIIITISIHAYNNKALPKKEKVLNDTVTLVANNDNNENLEEEHTSHNISLEEQTNIESEKGTEINVNENYKIETPDLLGMDFDKASNMIQFMGLNLKVIDYKYSEDYSQGCIIYQSSKSGISLEKGATLSVIVSKGKCEPVYLNPELYYECQLLSLNNVLSVNSIVNYFALKDDTYEVTPNKEASAGLTGYIIRFKSTLYDVLGETSCELYIKNNEEKSFIYFEWITTGDDIAVKMYELFLNQGYTVQDEWHDETTTYITLCGNKGYVKIKYSSPDAVSIRLSAYTR